MKPLQIMAVAGLLFFVAYYYVDNYVASHPLMGAWISDRELSLKQFYDAGVSPEQEKRMLETLGTTTMRVTKDQWMTDVSGKSEVHHYYIESEEDGCYRVKRKQKPSMNVCVRNGRLFVPAGIGDAHEVFVRR